MLNPGDVVATPAMVAVEPPKTATLSAEVPGTVGAVPGALEEAGPKRAEGKNKRFKQEQSRSHIKCTQRQDPSKLLE